MAKILYSEDINFKKLRDESVEMFLEVTKILNSHNIKYWLDFGTLLGAVREKKFIAWDGDVDLSTLEKGLENRDKLWSDFKIRGYSVKFENNNIKITKSEKKPGFFAVDIHTLRVNKRNYAEYLYGEKRSYFESIVFRIKIEIFSHIKPAKIKNVFLSEYDIMFKLLLNNGYTVSQIFELNDIKYIKNHPNFQQDFSLVVENQQFHSYSNKTSSKKIQIFISVLMMLPDLSLKFFFSALQKISFNTKEPLTRVEHDLKYFKNLKIITFYNYKFFIPANVEKYLESIYGHDWKVPKNKWELSSDSPMSN